MTCTTRPPSMSAALLATPRPCRGRRQPLGEADEHARADAARAQVGGERLEARARGVEERRPLDQILRRIAGERELGEDGQVGAAPLRLERRRPTRADGCRRSPRSWD